MKVLRLSHHQFLALAILQSCSLISISTALVTGKIHVMAAKITGGDTGGERSSLQGNSTAEEKFGNNRQVYARTKNNKLSIEEEKEKRQMEWMVRNTGTLLGPDSGEPGSMSERSVLLTFDLMRAWSRRAAKKESKAPHVVERLLQKLLREKDAGNECLKINTAVYNIVLESWANSREEGSAERSEEILLEMERMCQQGNDDVRPNEGSYNAVIKAYVKNGGRLIAPPKVEALVSRMERSETISPNRRSYNLLLYCLANSSLEDAAIRAEDALHRMLRKYVETGCPLKKPDINSYNQVLGAWARGRNTGFEHRMQSIYEELLKLPEDMDIKPNTDTFNAVMGGWLKSEDPSALWKVEEILATMNETYEKGNEAAKPDRITINTVTAAYAKTADTKLIEKSLEIRRGLEAKYRIKPDSISHNIVVDSWCKSGRADSPERVMELLNTMEREYKRGKVSSRPDGYTYSSVIGCFVKFARHDAPQRAEELLARMQDLYHEWNGEPVSTSVYNAVINAWASSGRAESRERVKELLQEMENNSGEDPSIPEPNRISYNTVIKAMRDGSADDAAYAERILTTLEQRGTDALHLLPDSYSYTSVITAYGRSDAPNKAEKALQLLERMILATKKGNIAAKPTVHSYNAALNACAFVEGSDEEKSTAFEVASKVFTLLKRHDEPDQTSYGTMIRVCSGLLSTKDKRREKMVEDIFQEACENGSVGRLVVTQMKFAASPAQHIRLMGREVHEKINVIDLPRAWTQNVRENARKF